MAAADRRMVLVRRIRLLSVSVIGYNVLEAIVAISAGAASGSVSLVGFGLDSVVEVASAAAIFWQFSGGDHERRERTALRIVSTLFFVLAAYLVATSGLKLVGTSGPVGSPLGMALTAASLVVMPLLSYAQRRAGRQLGSRSAVADSKQTLLCTYLSAVVLAGLGVEALFGWTWADPVAALVIAAVAVKEGLEARRGDACCTAPLAFDTVAVPDVHTDPADHACDCCAPEATAPAEAMTLQIRPSAPPK